MPHTVSTNTFVTCLSHPTNVASQYRGLWITDALLADTFHSFCRHSPRRYGSNVPGPLEARRRASKRKNGSLAFAGCGATPGFDAAVMFGAGAGIGAKEGWWKKQLEGRHEQQRHEQEQKPTESLLPVWLFGGLAQTTPSATIFHESKQQSVKPPRLKPEDAETTKARIKASIARTRELAEVQAVAEKQQTLLRQYPELSEYLFDHLVRKVCKRDNYRHLAPALADPSLHPPGSSNHLNFITHLSLHRISRKSWDKVVFPSLARATKLGLIPAQDVADIVELIPEVLESSQSVQSLSQVYGDWHGMLSAIEQSRVLNLEDLDPKFLSSWFQRIKSSCQSDTACFLLWRLRKFSGQTELGLASDLTIDRLRHVAEVDQEASAKFIQWLMNLPIEVRAPSVVQSTFNIVASAQKRGPLELETLEKWSLMLPMLCSEDLLDLPISRLTWLEASIESFGLQPEQRLLAVIWLVTRLWAEKSDAAARFAHTRFRDEFAETFANTNHVTDLDHLSRVVRTLDALPLLVQDSVFPFLQYFTEEDLMEMLGHKEHVKGLKACLDIEYAQFHNSNFTMRTARFSPQILHRLAETINTDLPAFLAMAQTLVLKSSENFRIVRRLLVYNMEFKLLLFKSWPWYTARRQAYLEIPSQQHQDQDHHQPIDISQVPVIDPVFALSLVEKLTMTFAVTPVVTPRASFHQVHTMYLFLHRYGAPIRPIIGRALWHSGVTRYGRSGAPIAQVKWCFERVRELEGTDVAEQLLWSSGMREKFMESFEEAWDGGYDPKFEMSELPHEQRIEAVEPGKGSWIQPQSPSQADMNMDRDMYLYRPT